MIQSIAVLANGPSLPKYWSEDLKANYDLVLGVNTASWKFEVDIWALLDPAVAELRPPDAPPWPKRIATFPQFLETAKKWIPAGVERIDMPWYNRDSKHLPKGLCRQHGVNNCNFTFACSLGLVGILSQGGAVDIFGMDITTDMDFAGKWGDRTAERWKKELPWIAHAWQPHWQLHGDASEPIRNFLYGETPFSDIVQLLETYKGGQTTRRLKIVN
jgi:hypothetical protein